MVHVAYRLWGGEGFYAKMCGTSMMTMFENTKEPVTVHIMHNERLTPENREKFCQIAAQFNQQVDFRNVEEIAGDTLKKFAEAYPLPSPTNASWYPLIAHEVFPDLDKIILFGADLIFNRLDIAELWNIELNPEFPFAAVPEFTKWGEAYGAKICYDGLVEHLDYFNADVFMAKPEFFRDHFDEILWGCKLCHKAGYILWEQDILNFLFSTRYQKLPSKFNFVINWERQLGKKPLQLEEAIYHYAGSRIVKPSFDTTDIYNKLYLECFMRTPWATVEIFGNIQKALDKIWDEQKMRLLHLTNLMKVRERAFFVHNYNFEAAKKIFAIKEDEMIIDAVAPDSVTTLLKALKEFRGQKIFYILIEDMWRMQMFLSERGFVEYQDYVSGMIFLTNSFGLEDKFDSRPLVQAM